MSTSSIRLIQCVSTLCLWCIATLCLYSSQAYAALEDYRFVDGPVEYVVHFDGSGAEGSMDDWVVSAAMVDDNSHTLPSCQYSKAGYRFDHWETEVPATVHLKKVSVADEQEFKGLSWESDEAVSAQIDWNGPLTLQSFSDENNHITLKAVWCDLEENELAEDCSHLSTFAYSPTVLPLYEYTLGTHGFLTTGSAPAGYANPVHLVDVPSWSNTPVYQMRHPRYNFVYFFTKSVSEYERCAVDGWAKQGVAFYADDASGIPVNRFLHTDDPAHYYSLATYLDGYVNELVAFHGLKLYTVSFDPNGGQAAFRMPTITTGMDKVINDPGCSYTRDGSAFAGWNTRADGKGDWVYPGGSLMLQQDSSEVVLYAQWKPIQLSVSVPLRIDLQMDTQGHLTTPRSAYHEVVNTGTTVLSIDALHITTCSDLEFVTDHPGSNQVALRLIDTSGSLLNLASVAQAPVGLFGGVSYRVEQSDSLRFTVEGECGGIEVIEEGGMEFAQLHWAFSLPSVTLSYCLDESHEPMKQQLTAGYSVAVAPYPGNPDGFKGWSLCSDGSGKCYSPGEMLQVSENMVLYPKW